jgi:hypothetical protein
MFLLQQLLPGVLAAVLLSGILAFAGRLWKASDWGDAVALAIGYAGGYAVTAGWPAFPAAEATQWLPYFAIAAMCLGVFDTLFRPLPFLRALIWIFFCAGLLRLLLQPKFQYGWSLGEGLLWIAVLTAGMLLLAGFLDAAIRQETTVANLLILTIVACGTGAALMLSGSMLLALLSFVFAAALAAILVVAFVLPKSNRARGVVPVAVALLTSLWLSGYFYAELPLASAVLIALAPFPALLLISLSDKKLSSWKDLLLHATLVLVPVAISVFLAFWASPPLDY